MITGDIESTSIEQWVIVLTLEDDPAPSLPEFQITARSAGDPSADGWADGEWSTAWSSSTGRAEALTPSIGTTGADLEVGENEFVILWCRIGTVVERVGRIRIT